MTIDISHPPHIPFLYYLALPLPSPPAVNVEVGGGVGVEPFRGSCIFSFGEDIFEFDFICRMRKCLKNASRIIRASWKWQKTSYRTSFNRQRSKLKSKWPSRSKESNRIFTLLGVYIHSAFCILLNKTISEYEFCVYNYVQ